MSPKLRRRIAIAGGALAAVTAVGACSNGSDANGETAASSAVNVHRLPLGDRKYTTSRARKGYVYSCQSQFSGGGAFRQGPWIDAATKTWDATEKITVQGSVSWPSSFSSSRSGTRNVLAGNGLPGHTTGTFPIQASDPAYQYDRNPNSIKSYTLRASLPRNPARTGRASCVGGTIGVMRTGIPLYSAFDAGGRDAVANEVQDRCDGHPQMSGQYHYHSLSDCIADRGSRRSHSRLVGWALDGFGIYGLRGEGGEVMTTAKLDTCHGHTHTITWNGRRVLLFHYHATRDFPYVVSCYRGTAITSATGLGVGGPGQGDGPPPGGAPPQQ